MVISTGCQSIFSPVSGIPAHRLPPKFLAAPKNNLLPVNLARLRQEPPREYLLDSGDILGIYIEGVLGEVDAMPPFHMPERAESNLPPAIGYPVPVREDGTLPLPLVAALRVRGLTLTQVENVIRKAYTVDQNILGPGKDRIFVTLIRERRYQVVVMRQEPSLGGQVGSAPGMGGMAFAETRSQLVELPAYQNDVLHALAETGGLPGESAKNEVKILRGSLADARQRDAFVQQFYACHPADPCLCFPPLPEDPTVIRIPLRLPPGQIPTFRPEDIILETGDIVLVESRDAEVFYTGGMLGGGIHQLPRDRDLDVIEAMAMVGGSHIYGGHGGGGGFGGGGFGGGFGASSVGGVPPGRLFILRKTPCNDQIIIAVDLSRAIRDPKSRPLVQSGDTLVLQYKPSEELLNFGLGTFFTFGIAELLQGGDN
jgi:protein involved in polysaccharide export with SLBB domain